MISPADYGKIEPAGHLAGMKGVVVMSIRVVFVCLGNICRSPMAEGVFQNMVDQAGLSAEFSVDSCGTSSWHVGEKAHAGTRKILKRHGIDYEGRSRQINVDDLEGADYLIAMDTSNLNGINRLATTKGETALLLPTYAPETGVTDVPDPYYTGRFDETYRLVEAGCKGLLDTIKKQHGL